MTVSEITIVISTDVLFVNIKIIQVSVSYLVL